ncbi:hypothetical protein HYDPIDRAFT_43798 [Hydnomerulius pinastri MD-312]|uniref:RNase H type-1 domain-containing protein n=1 Tax=Hydnomerulius pinastri MD-312 TaxID=994086 RepID=A0A0C9W1I9_9AGAM|nr:hypothetical protein HYDPIDRAFT_43798 [Hydnomerulius pinastri MD-312]
MTLTAPRKSSLAVSYCAKQSPDYRSPNSSTNVSAVVDFSPIAALTTARTQKDVKSSCFRMDMSMQRLATIGVSRSPTALASATDKLGLSPGLGSPSALYPARTGRYRALRDNNNNVSHGEGTSGQHLSGKAWRKDNGPSSHWIIVSDSEYLVLGMTEWLPAWKENGWRASRGRPKNLDLFQKLDAEIELLERLHDVKVGFLHVGREHNQDADVLAGQAARAMRGY